MLPITLWSDTLLLPPYRAALTVILALPDGCVASSFHFSAPLIDRRKYKIVQYQERRQPTFSMLLAKRKKRVTHEAYARAKPFSAKVV